MPDQLAAQLRMLIGYTAHDLRAGKPADARCYLAALKAVLASPAISPRPGHQPSPRHVQLGHGRPVAVISPARRPRDQAEQHGGDAGTP